MTNQQKITRFPKICQFEAQFAQLSLVNSKEQKTNRQICKGMFSQMNPKGIQENSKINKNLTHDIMQCKNKSHMNIGSTLELDLEIFKLYECTKTCDHNQKQCPFYHCNNDRRRPGNCYGPQLCQFVSEAKNCPYGYNCCQSHNPVEQYYQPEIYKKKICPHPNNCCYALYCPFAHNEKECRTLLIHNYQHDPDFYMFHYKIVECPYLMSPHDLQHCPYYHDLSDCRRCPHNYSYHPTMCENQNQCLGEKCEFAHNMNEMYFHPKLYKTLPCSQRDCIVSFCPCYHSQQDRRILDPLIATGIFKIVPKNRSQEFCYKKWDKLPQLQK